MYDFTLFAAAGHHVHKKCLLKASALALYHELRFVPTGALRFKPTKFQRAVRELHSNILFLQKLL